MGTNSCPANAQKTNTQDTLLTWLVASQKYAEKSMSLRIG